MLIFYYIVLAFFSVFSYVLIDPNLTLFNNKIWTDFRNYMVYWGYYRRDITSIVYLIIIILLFLLQLYIIKKSKKVNALTIAYITGSIMLFSYSFLSHDIFNYIFDAKIFTYYHQNPYLHRALDFPQDPWIRFMHWTHRTYPYGPVFLIITFIPSFLSFGKFIVAYGLFKIVFTGFYILSVYYLNKMNKNWAIFFATSPLVIVEGLMSLHNDLIGVALAIIGVYYLDKKKNVLARIILLSSAGIKYITTPLILASKQNKLLNYVVLFGLFFTLGYLSLHEEIQPWYFLAIFGLLPLFEELVTWSSIFCLGLLVSYYPYLRFGPWDKMYEVTMKHQIILTFFLLNIVISGVFFLKHRNRAEIQKK